MSNNIGDLEREREVVDLLLLLQPDSQSLKAERGRLETNIRTLRADEDKAHQTESQAFWKSIATRFENATTSHGVAELKTKVETYRNGLASNDPEWGQADSWIQEREQEITRLRVLEEVAVNTKTGDDLAKNWEEDSLKKARQLYEKALSAINGFQGSTSPAVATTNKDVAVNGNESLGQLNQAPRLISDNVELRLNKATLERKIDKIDKLLNDLGSEIGKTIDGIKEALQKVELLAEVQMAAEAVNSPMFRRALTDIRYLRELNVTNEDAQQVTQLVKEAEDVATKAGMTTETFWGQITPPAPEWAKAVLAGEIPTQPDEAWVQRLGVAVSDAPDFRHVNPEHPPALDGLIKQETEAFLEEIKDKKKKPSALGHLGKLLRYRALFRELTPDGAVNGQSGRSRRLSLQNLTRIEDVRDWLSTNDEDTVWRQAVHYQPKAKGIGILVGGLIVVLLAVGLIGGFFIGQGQVATSASPTALAAVTLETITPTLMIPTATPGPDIGATAASAVLGALATKDAARPTDTPAPDLAQTVVSAVLTAQATIEPTSAVDTATPDLVQTLVSAMLTVQATVGAVQSDEMTPAAATPSTTISPTATATAISAEKASNAPEEARYYTDIEAARTENNDKAEGFLRGAFMILGRDAASEYFYIRIADDVGWMSAQYVQLPEGTDPDQIPIKN